MNIRTKHHVVLWYLGLCFVVAGLITLAGCKESEPEPSVPSPEQVSSAVSEAGAKLASATEQKTCPVMGNPINKDLFAEYKGKKVFFCCAGCKPTFEADPEKYLAKLPQFSK
ncbi:MAG: YHS domain-containing protein [Planctomycetota bacterium]|jgi:YHS domain-containing protein